jgi:protein-tyrosine phosphatase
MSSLPPPRDPAGPYRICLVCLGNICRSPMAEAVLRAHAARSGADVVIDSAGTGDWHIGQSMNASALAQLGQRGYDGAAHRARQIDASWLSSRDVFLAMDSANLDDLHAMAATVPGASASGRILLFGEVGGLGGADIPDPYGGGPGDFAKVLDMLESAAPHILSPFG